MNYDKNGLGFAELVQVALYFPAIYQLLETLLETDPATALTIARKTLNAYNLGLIG